jgi:DnaJ-class molecular chaperone
MKDYYKYLGIDSSASHEEVKQAYKKTASYFTSKESLNENEKLMVQKIRAAFSILKDYHKRRDYDNIREGLGKNKRNQFDTIALRTFEPVKQNFLKPFLDINFNDNPDKILKNMDLSKNNNYYVQSFQSTAKSNISGGFDVEEKKYINKNGKESRNSKKYKTNKKNLFSE